MKCVSRQARQSWSELQVNPARCFPHLVQRYCQRLKRFTAKTIILNTVRVFLLCVRANLLPTSAFRHCENECAPIARKDTHEHSPMQSITIIFWKMYTETKPTDALSASWEWKGHCNGDQIWEICIQVKLNTILDLNAFIAIVWDCPLAIKVQYNIFPCICILINSFDELLYLV